MQGAGDPARREVLGRYRHWPISLGLAVVIGFFALGSAFAATDHGARSRTPVTLATPFFLVVGTVGVIRALRKSLTVTTVGIERRGLIWNWALPWSVVTGTAVRRRFWGSELVVRNNIASFVAVVADRHRTLAPTLEARRLMHPPVEPVTVWRPQTQRQGRMVLLLVLLVFATGAMFVLRTGIADQRYFVARRHDQRLVDARIVDWRVIDDLGDDDQYHDRTEATVRFTTGTGDVVTTAIARWGDVARPELLQVVYDPAKPTDADFPDRPSWANQESSARGRLILGAIGGAVGTIALLVAVAYCALVPLTIPEPPAPSRW